jgi:aspartokinase/homoserine dehydrogenase 1
MWVVHKFGGTSVASAERYRNVGRIILDGASSTDRQAAVVSAMSGVTNALIALVELAGHRDAAYAAELRKLRAKHIETVGELMTGAKAEALVARLEKDFDDIEDLLRAIWLLKTVPHHALDLVSGFGEIWSAQLLCGHLAELGHSVTWLDAREVLHLHPGPATLVDWETSQRLADAWFEKNAEPIVVVTGFVATGADGVSTTLGRNGSDFTGSIFGALLKASQIIIWTDVDGVMSANPRLVPDAVVLEGLSYNEAMELAYFGAKVIHPSTMAPAVRLNIPIVIKNTFAPERPGTVISEKTSGSFTVKGIATVDDMALVNVEGTSMIGVPGIASRLFSALREAGVNVVMISQGSSEHSICFVVPQNHAQIAQNAVEEAFFAERHHGQIQTIEVQSHCTVLAVVGDRMAGATGVAAKFFGALGNAGINIRAVAQGSSERNISIVIESKDAQRALRAVHSGFYLSNQTISIGVVGPGVVGATLLAQLEDQSARLSEEFRIDLRVRGIANSRQMVLDEQSIDLADWKPALVEGPAFDFEAFTKHIKTDSVPHAVIIDCTANEVVARHYSEWLKRGIHVITPNKKANSAEFDYYQTLRDICRTKGVHYLYETTVGAGLPIIQTLHDLIQTGDEVLQIEGILSGTLSYLFNAFDGSKTFSTIVTEAKSLGYTEPDPRDDLSGTDVARKLVILAREIGLKIEMSDVKVESLVPANLREASPDEFMKRLPEVDQAMATLLAEANAAGEVLRYVGVITKDGKAEVALRRYPATHAFARIQLTDNIVLFKTRRYQTNPLVIQGPGAGPEVTAGGAFADLLRLTQYLGASL